MVGWLGFCLVGYGRHSRTKLLPAIENLNAHLEGIVTSVTSQHLASKYSLFPNLSLALSKVSDRTCFLIATPPSVHFSQAQVIISHGHDVLIEKPGFICVKDLETILSIKSDKQLLSVAYMYKHTQLFERFLQFWAENSQFVKKVEIRFLIPTIPSATFRSDGSAHSSIIYDIGCYIADTLVEMCLDNDAVRVTNAFCDEGELSHVLISSNGAVEVFAEFGFGFSYTNMLSVTLCDNSRQDFTPFYWGRSGVRTIVNNKGGCSEVVSRFDEPNSFELMLSKNREVWCNQQANDLQKLMRTTQLLQNWAFQVYE